MPSVYLVSDTRERHVHGFIDTIFEQAGAAHTVAQINTGDYLICRRLAGEPPEILACVERKSLKDFAASFKDGRYENRLKMLDLRDKTGCQLYFFVEGPAYPKPGWKIARIPYGSILSAMTNLMIRDGIHVVQTENEMGTAQRLLDFVRGFEKTDIPYTYPLAVRAGAPGKPPPSEVPSLVTGAPSEVPSLVMGAVEKSDDLLVVEMWAKLAGISVPTAQVIASAFSIADLVGGQVSAADLDALRTCGGRQLAKKGKASLRALQRGAQKEEIRILSGVPGVSPAMAAQVLAAAVPSAHASPQGMAALLASEPGALAGISIQQKGRSVRLGAARADRIVRLLRYAPGAPAGNAAAPTVSAGPLAVDSPADMCALAGAPTGAPACDPQVDAALSELLGL